MAGGWPDRIVVVGGGTAGWLAAMMLSQVGAQRRPDATVTVIESSKIGVIGVGEGSTAVFRQMLRRFGLRLWDAPPGGAAAVTQFEPGPLFRGVTALPIHRPNPVALLPGEWPGTRVLAATRGGNAWALYTTDPAWRSEAVK